MTTAEILEAIKDIPSNVQDGDTEMHVKYLQSLPGNPVLLDFGTGWGKLVISMALACPQALITTFEPGDIYGTDYWKKVEAIFQSHLKEGINPQGGGIVGYKDNSYDHTWQTALDVLSIDSSHTYENTKHEVAKYFPFVKPGGLILLHDYNVPSVGVKQAVDEYLAEHKDYEIIDEAGYTTVLRKL